MDHIDKQLVDDRLKKFTREQFQDRVTVWVPEPDSPPAREFVGHETLLTDCEAACLGFPGEDPLNFRIFGPPGVGKNELVYQLARRIKRPLYVMQGHEDITPEDIVCTARINTNNTVEYVGSPLVAAMLHGGLLLFDELDKVPTRSLSTLAPVLDDRRTATSTMAGFTLKAHHEFRFCAILNQSDPSAYALPDYIEQRTRPAFSIGLPSRDEIQRIIAVRFTNCEQNIIESFMSKTEKQTLTPRDVIQVLRYAMQLMRRAVQLNGCAAEADMAVEKALKSVMKRT